MANRRLLPLGALPLVGALLLAGCGRSGGNLAPVQGTVTLDGKPLAGAMVEFELDPGDNVYQKTTGSISRGKTDANGRYTLEFTHEEEGALVGKHIVRITTRAMTIDAEGKEVAVPERLPARFHRESKLTAEVEPGSNQIDFPLQLEASPDAAQ